MESSTNSASLRRSGDEKSSGFGNKRAEKPPSYLYPLQKPAYIIPTTKNSKTIDLYAESDTDINDSPPMPPKEEEIKPKLVRPRNLEAHFKQILSEKQFDEKELDEDQLQSSNEERFFKNDSVKYLADRIGDKRNNATNANAAKPVYRTKSVPTAKDTDEIDDGYRYRHRESKNGHGSNEKVRKLRESFEGDDDFEYNENLTDKQKYHQSLMKKQHSISRERREYFNGDFRAKRSISPARRCEMKSSHRNDPVHPSRPYYEVDERTIESKKHRNISKHYDDVDFERNPYKDQDNLPYLEKPKCMAKSPLMRYKSYEESECRDENCEQECFSDCEKDFAPQSYPSKYRGMYESKEHSHMNRQRYRDKHSSPDTDHHPKDKFKQIDRQRPYDKDIERQPYPIEKSNPNHLRRMVPIPPPNERFEAGSSKSNVRHGPMARQSSIIDWSSDEEHFGRPQSPSNVRIIPREREHYEKNTAVRMGPSKSLSNLVRGYRHSYAEPPPVPRTPMPRNSGRVGLAAVNPY